MEEQTESGLIVVRESSPVPAALEPPAGPHAYIQWKGTEVCMDVYCACGERYHVDADFAYFVKCLACGKVYEMPSYVSIQSIDAADPRISNPIPMHPEDRT